MSITEYKIEISTNGTTYTDISSHVIRDSVVFTYKLHSEGDIQPNSNTAKFKIAGDDSLFDALANVDSPIYCRISRNEAFLCIGIIAPALEMTTTIRKLEPVEVTVEDYTICKLKRKFSQNVNYSNYYVSNPSSTDNSILHCIASLAGVEVSSYPSILEQVPFLVATTNDDNDTYFSVLSKLLYEFGYTFYFNNAGQLAFYNFANAPTNLVSITNTLISEAGNANSNIRRKLTTVLKRGSYDKVKLTWYEKELKSDATVFELTDGAKDSFSCYVGVESGKYYPDSSGDGTVYTTYQNPNLDILSVVSATLTYQSTGLILNIPFTNYGKKCKFAFYNPNTFTSYITKLKAVGSAWIKGSKGITETLIHADVRNTLEYDCSYISNATQAKALSVILRNFYAQSKVTYEATSYDFFDLGSYVKIVESIQQGFIGYGRIRDIIYNPNGSYTYTIESIAAYTNTDTSTTEYSIQTNPNIVTQSNIQDGTITAKVSNVAAAVVATDSLQSAGSYVYTEVNKAPVINDYRSFIDNDELSIQKWDYQSSLTYITDRCNVSDSEIGIDAGMRQFTACTVRGKIYRLKSIYNTATHYYGLAIFRYVLNSNLKYENDYIFTLFEGTTEYNVTNGAGGVVMNAWGNNILVRWANNSYSTFYAGAITSDTNGDLTLAATLDISSYTNINDVMYYPNGYAIDDTHFLFGGYGNSTGHVSCLVLSGNILSINYTPNTLIPALSQYIFIGKLNSTQYIALGGALSNYNIVFTLSNYTPVIVSCTQSTYSGYGAIIPADNVIVTFNCYNNITYNIRTWDGVGTWAATANNVTLCSVAAGYMQDYSVKVVKLTGDAKYYIVNQWNANSAPTYTGPNVYVHSFTYATGALTYGSSVSCDLTLTGYPFTDQEAAFINMGKYVVFLFIGGNNSISRFAQWGYNPAWIDSIKVKNSAITFADGTSISSGKAKYS